MSSTSSSPIESIRLSLHHKMRPHKRSRRGCGNCRLRRVKCDEKKPGCERCRNAHINCSYAKEASHLESSHEHAVAYLPQIEPQFSGYEVALSLVNKALDNYHSDSPEIEYDFQLEPRHLNILLRFQKRTVHCIGSQWDMEVCETEFLRLATLNPFLLHVAITCTAMHDRYLEGQTYSSRTGLEAYHWAKSAQIFNHEISRGSLTCDLDAVWMAANLLNWVVLFAIETKNLDEVWPLAPTISGLPWLPMQKGLRTLWPLAGPTRPESLYFSSCNSRERCLGLPPPESGIDGIPRELVDLFELNEFSTPENNPYHGAIRYLSNLINNPSSDPRSLKFLGVVNNMDDEFEALLYKKDPRALLLMSIWYGLVPESAWWISPRASLERKAIFCYLDRHHGGDPLIQRVLASNWGKP